MRHLRIVAITYIIALTVLAVLYFTRPVLVVPDIGTAITCEQVGQAVICTES